MTRLIAHRINTLEDLARVPTEFGAEIDLRDAGRRLILAHDPFREDGLDFEDFLAEYRHGPLICNIKSERIEPRVIGCLERRGIEDFFLLDSSFPMIHQLTSGGESRIALRFSEYEGLDTLENMRGRADWVWVDCLTRLPIDRRTYTALKDMGYRLCLVSPCLLDRANEIPAYKDFLERESIRFDAICLKLENAGQWTA